MNADFFSITPTFMKIQTALQITKSIPPTGTACVPSLIINTPHKGVAAEIPRFAAVKYKPFANSGAPGAAAVTQY